MVGDPHPSDTQWVEGLWTAIPEPKARIRLCTGKDIRSALDEVATTLLRAPRRPAEHAVGNHAHEGPNGLDADGGPDSSQEHSRRTGPEQAGQSADPADHSSHAEHDERAAHDTHSGHAGHDMGMEVSGLPMADRGDDRDGLRLDQLHIPLGPALLDWPAGLVLRLSLQGDVIQEVRVELTRVLRCSSLPFWDEPWMRAAAGEQVTRGQAARRLCAAHLDSVGRLLAVAGWSTEAQRARAARDVALADWAASDVVAAVGPLVRRVGRSRTLRRLTYGLGELSTNAAATAGVSGPAWVAGGDVWSRLSLWLEEAAHSAALCDETRPLDTVQRRTGPRGTVGGTSPPSQALLDVLPCLLEGAEFAGARLILASLDPDIDELVPAGVAEVPHG
ncbi:hypothetical protein AB0D13_19535 [Streptomyces sp. NPDC048430]|uniref:hypothetical protein n=1 Tax=Streptomyces sp. NPDC048430 TaxID=3155388 RepID=UPI003429BFF5